MKICGFITEYNPFHSGHYFHAMEAKKISESDFTIAVMSGDYVQRGEPACIDKYTRASMALNAGVDLVIEMPSYSCTMSAEHFSKGGVHLLNALNCVDSLCFGSELGDTLPLSDIAQILAKEPENYKTLLQEELKKGSSFPKARVTALKAYIPDAPKLDHILQSPNNILGIEYLKAMIQCKSTISPITLKREGNDYHSTELKQTFSSASAIRLGLMNSNIASLKSQFPDESFSVIEDYLSHYKLMQADDFSDLLQYALFNSKFSGYTDFADVSEDLSDRIQNMLYKYESFCQFSALLKTKELTYSRISRALLHIMLGIKKNEFEAYKNEMNFAPYCKVLGFRKDAKELLTYLTKNSSIPILTNLSDAEEKLSSKAYGFFQKELTISDIYQGVLARKSHTHPQNELARKMLVI